MIRTFLSYSHLDARIAGYIKAELVGYSLEVFLAHEDIEPTCEWQDVILEELKACDVFLPLLSSHFRESKRVDQETGFGLALNKLLIPIKLDADPHGFIGRYQALRFDLNDYPCSCRQIINVIATKPELQDPLKDCIIQRFLSSNTYQEGRNNVRLLEEFGPYSPDQLSRLLRGSAANGQIYDGEPTRHRIARLVAPYLGLIDEAAWGAFGRSARL